VKTPIVAITCLIVGFGFGWIVRAPSKVDPSEGGFASTTEGSILPIPPTGNSQNKASSGPKGDTTKNRDTLFAILEHQGHSTSNARAYQFLTSLSSKDLLRLTQSIEPISESHRYRYAAISAIVGRWAEIDPESLFAHALTATNSNFKRRGVTQAIQAIAHRNRSRARALVNAIKDSNLRGEASRLVIRATAKDDPKAALAALSGEANSHYEHDNIFRMWGDRNPQAAAAHLETITGTQSRREAIQGLARSWGSQEPEAALEWAVEMSNRLERREAVRQIMGTVSDITKGKTLLENLNLKGVDRRQAINALAARAIRADLGSAIEWIETLEPSERSEVTARQLSSISQLDPERARQLFDENMSSRMRGYADNIASNLAETDLAGAQAWVDSLPQSETKEQAIRGIVSTLQETDPQAALDYLDSMGISSRTNSAASYAVQHLFNQDQAAAIEWIEAKNEPRLTNELLNHWAQQDPAEAAAYAMKLGDSDQQSSALQGIMTQWSRIEPEEAIRHYETLEERDKHAVMQNLFRGIAGSDIDSAVALFETTAGNMTDESEQAKLASVADDLVNEWAEVDVTAAASWAAGLELPEARKQAIEEAASEWIDQDSMAASKWISELPAGPDKDAAIRRLVSHVATDDASTAFEWANTLSDESRRSSELRSVLSRWKNTDPDAALQALQSANLSDDAYNKLAKQFEQ
jgi:hypothetical protein